MTLPRMRLDLWVFLAPLCLIAVGVLLQSSAAHPIDYSAPILDSQPARHGLYAAGGLVLCLLVARVDYRLLGSGALAIYATGILLLALVFFVGHSANEVRRWINFGLLPVQPSEVAKITTIIALARYLGSFAPGTIRWFHTGLSLVIVAVPTGLVYAQPDLGSAVVFGALWLGIAVAAAVPVRHLLALAATAALALPVVMNTVLQGYMRDRLRLFANPEADPLGSGYNVLQSAISVGSGGLFGKGLFNGSQNQLDFLRVQQTDFVFSVLGEELGFLGAMLVFGLYVLLLSRGLWIGLVARDAFGRLLATGVVMMLLTHVFINVGVNTRLLPVTGIPLPFLSFGGTSLITALVGLGILQSVHIRRERERPRPRA